MLALQRFIFTSNENMKKRYILLSWLFIIGASIVLCPQGINNTFALLLENNYFIPKESSFCAFRGTVSNGGSGEGWLYGEDSKYYYMLNVDYKSESDPSYYVLRRGKEPQSLEAFDHMKQMKTEIDKWDRGEITLFDFISNTEHVRLEFIKRGEGKFRR